MSAFAVLRHLAFGRVLTPIRAIIRNALIDMDAPTQQPMATGWASFNPYAAQQQAQMEEYMRQQQLMELQRQVRSRSLLA